MSEQQTPQTSSDVDMAAARKAQKSRNRWLALALVAFVVIVGLTTAMRLRETLKDDCNRFYIAGGVGDLQDEQECRAQKANAIELDESGAPVDE